MKNIHVQIGIWENCLVYFAMVPCFGDCEQKLEDIARYAGQCWASAWLFFVCACFGNKKMHFWTNLVQFLCKVVSLITFSTNFKNLKKKI